MNYFPKQAVLGCCSQYGPQLHVPAGIDGPRLMAAISSVESSVGYDCGPRHEPSYDVGGGVYTGSQSQRDLVAAYPSPAGSLLCSPAACSYGPWQMMFDNFTGLTPAQLETEIDALAQAFVKQFNSYVIGFRKASSLDEIGECWNAGHITPDPAYTVKLQAAYAANLLLETP